MRSLATLLTASFLCFAAVGSGSELVQLMQDPGFEEAPAGGLETTKTGKGWEVQRTGRPHIQKELLAECISDKQLAHEGNNVLKLSLPKISKNLVY